MEFIVMLRWLFSRCFLLLCLLNFLTPQPTHAQQNDPDLFRRDNLVAWCIVPFDNQDRSPEQRAKMLRRIGIRKFAYDYRAKHIPSFDQEVRALKKHGVELTAWWFPTTLNDEAKRILDVLARNDVKTQLWITGNGGSVNVKTPDEQQARVASEVKRIRPIAQAAAKIGCTVGLYNHGGWFGEPENQIDIIEAIGMKNVGIVYNLHHGHGHLDRLPELLKTMQPHLMAFNLNGMKPGGDTAGEKILPLGAGTRDVYCLTCLRDSGYTGPVGILNHTQEDAEFRLLDNINGLNWLTEQMKTDKPAGPKPKYRTWKPRGKNAAPNKPAKQPLALNGGRLVPGRTEFRSPPLTATCRATLTQHARYNILMANDSKESHDHWEVFSLAGRGTLSMYLPGFHPDHVHSQVQICDTKPHTIRLLFEPSRVRLLVDGKVAADATVKKVRNNSVPGKFGIGRLVSGPFRATGTINWVHIQRGIQTSASDAAVETVPKQTPQTVALWNFVTKSEIVVPRMKNDPKPTTTSKTAPPYSKEFVSKMLAEARAGDAMQGVMVFANSKTACLSCHRIGQHGSNVGPNLADSVKQRTPQQIVESLFWPQREVKPEYVNHVVVTDDGRVHKGYLKSTTKAELELLDPSTGKTTRIKTKDVDEHTQTGSLMPNGLTAAMSPEQQRDLLKFLLTLNRDGGMSLSKAEDMLRHSHMHAAAPFPYDRKPLHPEHWPNWSHSVNRDRVYDFYGKQADYFRAAKTKPALLTQFPGLDGGRLGHWGNQSDDVWKDDRWNNTILSSVQAGVFTGFGQRIGRGVCVQLESNEKSSRAFACFDPDTLTYRAVWTGTAADNFITFSDVRHGFVRGLTPNGSRVKLTPQQAGTTPTKPFQYHGFYRHGKQVIFAYRIGDTEFLDAPRFENGQFQRDVRPAAEHPARRLTRGGASQWPQILSVEGTLGTNRPYAVDTIPLPFKNPWNALMFCGGHDFLSDGTAIVCTMMGDAWRVTGLDDNLQNVKWKRFAAGLHQPLGVVVHKDKIFVQCRDQLTRLHDFNDDGEADFYECFSNAFQTSPAGHDFICGLQRDDAGNFYTASGNQGIVRISPDGQRADVVATGFRNPDGLGLAADGTITVPCSEGEWTPASMICAVRPQQRQTTVSEKLGGQQPPYFGYGGPKNDKGPALPLVYLPRGLDNSAGGQVQVEGNRWGPLQDQLLHLSFGTGSHFLLLRDEVDGQLQGAVVPLPGEFLSGAHRGRFNPRDGQLYVTGMDGWGTYTPDDGCLQRVRYTGDRVQLPTAFHVHRNGILLEYSENLDDTASTADNHFAQCWNYRYTSGYGSPEYSTRHFGTPGHDTLKIASAHVGGHGRSLFLEIPELQAVNVLHLRLKPDAKTQPHDLFITVHKLDTDFKDFAGYSPVKKKLLPHPMLVDLATSTKRINNPRRTRIAGARRIELEAARGLSFSKREIKVRAGEPLEFVFHNPDVVPHNWALAKPGSLQRVGELSNALVADPEAAVRHYIPKSDDVICYVDITFPHDSFTIYFHAPKEPGRYPYLCTFPGHWKVMNGVMIVE